MQSNMPSDSVVFSDWQNISWMMSYKTIYEGFASCHLSFYGPRIFFLTSGDFQTCCFFSKSVQGILLSDETSSILAYLSTKLSKLRTSQRVLQHANKPFFLLGFCLGSYNYCIMTSPHSLSFDSLVLVSGILTSNWFVCLDCGYLSLP